MRNQLSSTPYRPWLSSGGRGGMGGGNKQRRGWVLVGSDFYAGRNVLAVPPVGLRLSAIKNKEAIAKQVILLLN